MSEVLYFDETREESIARVARDAGRIAVVFIDVRMSSWHTDPYHMFK